MHIHKLVYIKTFKIAPTCFDPKIIYIYMCVCVCVRARARACAIFGTLFSVERKPLKGPFNKQLIFSVGGDNIFITVNNLPANFIQAFGLIKSTGFSNVTPCSLIEIYGLFGRTYCIMRVVTILHGVTSQKTVLFIVTAVRTYKFSGVDSCYRF